MKPFAAQFAQPAGAVADEMGMKTRPEVLSTATECALLPVGICFTTACVAASMMLRTGVHGEAARERVVGEAVVEQLALLESGER